MAAGELAPAFYRVVGSSLGVKEFWPRNAVHDALTKNAMHDALAKNAMLKTVGIRGISLSAHSLKLPMSMQK